MKQQKYIILDRDGVINYDSNNYIKTADEWTPIPRSLEGIKLLSEKDYFIIIISNQSGLTRKIITYKNFSEIYSKMIRSVEDHGGNIGIFSYCSDSNDKSFNRKPNPGMFLDIAERMKIDLKKTFSIGDSPRDLFASIESGCIPIGVRTGNGHQIEKEKKLNVLMFDDLLDAVKYIIKNDK